MIIDGYNLEFASASHKTIVLEVYNDDKYEKKFLKFFGVSFVSMPFEYISSLEIKINHKDQVLDGFEIPEYVDVINVYSFIGMSSIGFICASGMIVEDGKFTL